jgi:hypothetical protein
MPGPVNSRKIESIFCSTRKRQKNQGIRGSTEFNVFGIFDCMAKRPHSQRCTRKAPKTFCKHEWQIQGLVDPGQVSKHFGFVW